MSRFTVYYANIDLLDTYIYLSNNYLQTIVNEMQSNK